MITEDQAYALEDLEQAVDGVKRVAHTMNTTLYNDRVQIANEAIKVAEQELGERTVTIFLEKHLQKHLTDK